MVQTCKRLIVSHHNSETDTSRRQLESLQLSGNELMEVSNIDQLPRLKRLDLGMIFLL